MFKRVQPDRTQASVLESIIATRDERVFDLLITALQDKDAEVRQSSVAGLYRLKDKRAIKPLVSLLEDESPAVRSRAVQALGELGATEALAKLEWLKWNDAEADSFLPPVRNAAAKAIEAITAQAQPNMVV